ncbi:Hypothetical protein I595_3547 [Croceitalea dokdonensis DOKDO 023]|uniref:Translocation and assembly module TamB C-terminal domain-containing protein n=1 Tax=Croceitalea dokdonensis DOKDO 023 TaxID=1300341 RepID=A0A0P7AB98_9FLAO|nr:Hypothetical protein I595_3547 [Croceitalea dokdonensis DOKDO 023]
MLVIATVVFSLPAVQTHLAKRATDHLNTTYGTGFSIKKVKFSPFTLGVDINEIFVEDHRKDTLFYIQELSTSLLSLKNIRDGQLEFGGISAKTPYFKMKTYEGEEDSNLDVFVAKLTDSLPRDPGKPPFYLSATEITMQDGRYRLIDENRETVHLLNFDELQITATDFLVVGPKVSMQIESLALHTQRELRIQQLKTRFKYTKQQMRFDSLLLRTTASKLQGDLVFDYERKDFKDFLNKVKITGTFLDSEVAFDEVNVYYNEFGRDKKALFSGTVQGTLNDFEANELILLSDNTGVRGDFRFRNIFKRSEPFIMNAKMDNVTSSYYQLRGLLPDILGKSIPSSFQKFGQFTIRGNTEVTPSSVDAEINLQTAIGSSYSDLQITNITNVDKASYRGFISLMSFDLGAFANSKRLGKATLDVNVEGKGFIADYLNTEAIGEVYSIQFNGYTYQNLKVSGILKESLFDGNLVADDENFKLSFKGLADFAEERNNFNFIADVAYADFNALNFVKNDISIFKGNVRMDITGNTLDNMSGEVKFQDTNYENGNDTYYFDDFKITSIFQKDSTRLVEINSPDIITGYMRGKFKIAELPKLFQNSVGSIYTNYKPFEISSGQKLDFNFKIYNKIVNLLMPDVNLGAGTFIKGNIVADEGDLKLTFKSPEVAVLDNKLDDIELKIDNKNPLFNTFISVDNMSTVYYDLKDFQLINTTLKDTLFFRAEFKGGSALNDSYNLNFYHTFNQNNKSVIGLKTSEVNFKGNKWVLNKAGNRKNKVIINRSLDSIQISDIVMDNGKNEQIRLKGELADSTYKDLQLQFKIVSLNKITPEIDSLALDGEVNGFLNILQKEGKYLPSASLEVGNFSVNQMELGDMELVVFGNNDLTEFGVNSWLVQEGQERFGLNGKINNNPTGTTLDLLASLNDFNLSPFAPLGQGIISEIRGFASGNARITGAVDSPLIDGSLSLNEAGLGIPYLNVNYDFAPLSRIRLFDQTFEFQDILLNDTVFDTQSVLDGTISHTAFDDWILNLNVETQNDRFLILNTEFDEGQLYYGTGFVSGTGQIYGPTTALNIDFEGASARGTELKIPLSDVTSVGDYSFINFTEKRSLNDMVKERTVEEYKGVELFFDLEVTPDAEVEIIVDRESGSTLKGTGAGLLLIEINTNDKFIMNGEFAVVTGDFRFKRAGIIDKTFVVEPGGRLIWEGDPLQAQLDLQAKYALNANPAPLLDNPGYTRRIPTEVVVRLDGVLESPTIDFDIQFPGTNSVVKSELEYRLQDPTIESNNAFFLLAQGTFVNEQTGLNQQAVAGNILGEAASGLLNQVLGEGNDKLNIGLSYEQGYLDGNTGIDTEDRIGVNISTQISDRVLVNGRVGVPVGGVSQTVVAGDVEVQILLNEDGSLSAKVFNRENEIQQFLADGQQGYTQGVGLSYQVDFNTFQGLFRRIFNLDKKEVESSKKQKGNLEKQPFNSVMGKDSLIQFSSKRKQPKI